MLLEDQSVLIEVLQARIVGELRDDERVGRIWLGGSLGRGEGDALSDIDLVIVASPGRTQELKSSLAELIAKAGPVALVHEAPQNAPAEGAQLNVLYDTDPLPIYIDWSLWPPVEHRPADVSVLFERGSSLPASAEGFQSMLAEMPRAAGNPRTEETLRRFNVFMTPILAKHAARGWFDSVNRMVDFMQIGPADINDLHSAIELCRRVLDKFGTFESAPGMACIRRYLTMIADDPA